MESSAPLTPGCRVGELKALQQRELWEAVPGLRLAAVWVS